MRCSLVALIIALAIASPAPADEGPLPKEFEAIDTVVVVFLENRSFVNLLPSFPGALGIAQVAPDSLLQRDRDGSVLPHLPPVWIRYHMLPRTKEVLDVPCGSPGRSLLLVGR